MHAVVVRKDAWYDFNLLKFIEAWCPSIWSVLENVPCALENNVYSIAFVWNVLYKSIKSGLMSHIRSMFACCLSVWMIYPLLLWRVKVSFYCYVLISLFRSVNSCFICFDALNLNANKLINVMSS